MKTFSFLLLICVSLFSCRKGFEELNMNPNVSTAVDPDALFAYAQNRYHTDYLNGVRTEIWGLNTWMQVQASINGISSAGDEYFISGDALNNTWSLMYADVLGNIEEAIRLTKDDPESVNKLSTYRIYRAYIFHRLTDLWDNIPYSAAHNVINDENQPDFSPSYDTQSVVYQDLISELRSASADFDPSKPNVGAEDWIYRGDVDKWKRFANSLTLRLAMRISDKAPDIALPIIQELTNEDHFIRSNQESARFPHSSNARNPLYELENTAQGMYNPSDFLIDMFLADNDPRIARYAEFAPQSVVFGTFEYVGVPSFLLSSDIDPNALNSFTTSYVGSYFLSPDLPGNTFSYAETCFLLAEAALKGYGGNMIAGAYYDLGVRAHMDQLGIAQSEVDDYLNGPGQFNGTLEHIIQQKWKTFVYTDAIELYSEWRRTGFPVLHNAQDQPIDASRVPVRLAYPAIETSLNGPNVMAVGHGINDFFTKVWWDE